MSSLAWIANTRTRASTEPISASSVGRAIPIRCDRDAQEPETIGGAGADAGSILADAAGEDQRVKPVHRGRHRGDAGAEPVEV